MKKRTRSGWAVAGAAAVTATASGERATDTRLHFGGRALDRLVLRDEREGRALVAPILEPVALRGDLEAQQLALRAGLRPDHTDLGEQIRTIRRVRKEPGRDLDAQVVEAGRV